MDKKQTDFLKWKSMRWTLLAGLTTATLAANGTRLPGVGATQIAKGYAWAATVDEPSAVYANPAGLASKWHSTA